MRSIRLSQSLFGALVLTASGALAACSSAVDTGTGSPISHPGESSSSSGGTASSSGGSNNNNGSSSGSSSGGTASSSSGSSSGGTASGSSSSGGTSVPGTTITADTTWADGTMISASTTIAKGVTVTIASGATITVSAGASITIDGTLTAAKSTTHAKITGTGWTGLVVAAGGTLTADSLDLSGAMVAIDVSGNAEYDDGTITSSAPFKVEATGTLTTKHAGVVTATGPITVSGGTFTASYLDMDVASSAGLDMATGTANISDSTFHTTQATQSPDMINSTGLGNLTMLYTTITGRHCSFHFDTITSFDLENLNVNSSDYGFMMYGSSATAGTRVLKNSNFDNAQYGIAESGMNGAIAVSGTYFSSTAKISLADQEVTISSPATSSTTNTVGPRPAQ